MYDNHDCQIYSNHEVYLTDLDHDEVPALFWWFPNQDDYQPPPPADETITEKLERITNSIKVFGIHKNPCSKNMIKVKVLQLM